MDEVLLAQSSVHDSNEDTRTESCYPRIAELGCPEPKQCVNGSADDPVAPRASEDGEKRYHVLKPPARPAVAPEGSARQTVKEDRPSLLSGVPAKSTPSLLTTRRSRRLAKDETVPLKKRKRVISPDLEDDEYILPTHVQLEVDKTVFDPACKRLRPKRSSQYVESSELIFSGQSSPVSDKLAVDCNGASDCDTKAEPAAEPVPGGDETSLAQDESAPLLPPKRKRGRPRKNHMPQRCAPACQQAPSVKDSAQERAACEQERPRAAAGGSGPDSDGRLRRARKGAAPCRRKVSGAPAAAERAGRPGSPPAADTVRLLCAGLSTRLSLRLTDRLLLLELPTRQLQPCTLCSSLTSRHAADVQDEHCHVAVRELEPRRRLELLVTGLAPAADGAGRRPVHLDDQGCDQVVGVTSETNCRRRGRRRGVPGCAPLAGADLECQICGKQMLSISRLKKHQLVHTDERPFHCDKCPKSFKSIHVLNAHQLTHINYRPFKCVICHQTFAKKWTLRGHMSTHERQEGSDDLVCVDCGCSFQDRSTYESHIKIHTGERKWECKVCHRGFAKKLKLRKHMVVHSQAMLHKCHLCDREFRWKEKLVKHVMLHTGERPFKCCEPRCVKSFRAHSDLNVHIRNVHKKQPKKLDYPIVKSEPKPNHCELLLMRVNEMDGIPPCDLCTQTFSSKDEYLNHIIPAHRDQEAYVCHPCKRVFDNKRIYDDHVEERHRRGEIMWRCQLCPKIFNKRSLFEGHKTLHATKFQCKICFRFASDEKRLQVHIINHRYTDIDNSSHACTICCRQFKLRFSLKNHMFKMHSIDLPSLRKPPMRKFECSICHARFVRPTPAYNHMVRVHNIRPEPEVQDMFDLTNLSVEHPEAISYQAIDPDDPNMMAALQNNIRIKVEAMAAQGMWDASEADGSTYLGGSAARRRQPPRMAAGDAPPARPPAAGQPPALPSSPAPQQQPPRPLPPPPPPPPPPAPPAADGPVKTLLHLSPGKRGQVVRVTDSPPAVPLQPPSSVQRPAGDGQRQQIIVIQQEGEEEIDLSRVLGNTTPADAQTLTMNADGVLVDDQGNAVSLMVEGGGAATHLLQYLRGSEPVASMAD